MGQLRAAHQPASPSPDDRTYGIREDMAEKEREQDLEFVLRKYGLEPTRWLPRFQEIGITMDNQLQYQTQAETDYLKREINFPFEEKALDRLMESYSGDVNQSETSL